MFYNSEENENKKHLLGGTKVVVLTLIANHSLTNRAINLLSNPERSL